MIAKAPSKFCLRFFFDDEVDELASIRDVLDEFFEMVAPDGSIQQPKRRPINQEHLVLSLPVSAFLEAEQAFFRAVILKIEDRRCLCYFVDMGFEDWVPRENLCYLPKSLVDYECLAIQCELADVAPPPDMAPEYPDDCGLKMMKLTNSDNVEILRDQPLLCKLVKLIKPEPVEFSSGWRFHRKLLSRLVVELSMPNNPNRVAAKPNGLARLLASLNLCALVSESQNHPLSISSQSYRSNMGLSGDGSSTQKSSCHSSNKVSRAENQGGQGRGRGRGRVVTTLTDRQCPALPFDD